MMPLLVAAALAGPCPLPPHAHVVARTRRVVVYELGHRTRACSRDTMVTLRRPAFPAVQGPLDSVVEMALDPSGRSRRSSLPLDASPARPPSKCMIPPSAVVLARSPAAVFGLEAGDASRSSMTVYGCIPGGRAWPLETVRTDMNTEEEEWVGLVASRPPFVALERGYERWKDYGIDFVRATDLRTGTRTAAGCMTSKVDTEFPQSSPATMRVVLSPTGRIACSQLEFDHDFSGHVTISTYGPEGRVDIDAGHDVEALSLHAEGGDLIWRHGDTWRSVAFP